MTVNVCDLEIVSYNVRGLSDFSKRKDVFDFLRNTSADIICLQELHVAIGKENVFKNQWGGRAWFSAVSSSAGGVGILIQNKTPCKFVNMYTNDKGSAIFLDLDFNGIKIKIINLYGPSDRDDPSFFEEIFRLANLDKQDHLIFCGDWNLTLKPDDDTFNYKARDRRPRSRELVELKCRDLGLNDVWRILNGNKNQYTWRKNNPLKCARLDFFLTTDSILNRALSCEILPAYRSDHSRISLRLKLAFESRGRGFWKFNCSLLKDLNYLRLVKRVIMETVWSYACPVYTESYASSLKARVNLVFTINDSLFLDTLLMKIRSETIAFSIKNTRQKAEKERMILKELHFLESISTPTSEDINQLCQKQLQLKMLREAANEGRIVRSRVRWYEEGEKSSSSYFLRLERRNFESKLIPGLNVGEHVVNSSKEILAIFTDHYEKLFRKNDSENVKDIDKYLNDTVLTRLTDVQSQKLDDEVTVEELGKTLLKLGANKSPGSDGFPYEFFKVFWGEMKHFVHRSLIYGLKIGELSITQREGHITLVPKPLKPRNLISSWRPINYPFKFNI